MKHIKRTISLFIILALALSLVPTSTYASAAEESHASETTAEVESFAKGDSYEVGKKVSGFTLGYIRQDNAGALYRWEHDKTGAKVYFYVNDDTNRLFSVAFKTEPDDQTGKLHILEHTAVAASEKYPGNDTFYVLNNTGFITSINASTFHSLTRYYVSSLDEGQLLNAADYYLDCSFNSLIKTEKNYFLREGWRYELEDKDSPINLTGIVLNEMRDKASNIMRESITHCFNELYKGSSYVIDSGGVPEEIPNLTYEELVSYYEETYHPSNSYTLIYGDVDMSRWLGFLNDSYFGAFEKQDCREPEKTTPRGNLGIVSYEFPVSKDTQDTSGAIIYAWDLPADITRTEMEVIDSYTDFLSDKSSPLMRNLTNSGIGSSYEIYQYYQGEKLQFMIYAQGADPSRAEEFRDIIDRSLAAIANDGLEKDTVDSYFEEKKLSTALETNSTQKGYNMSNDFVTALETGTLDAFEAGKDIEAVRAYFEDGRALKLLERVTIKNDNKVVCKVECKPGLAEKNEKALEKKLADYKASLSDEELEALIAQTKEFKEWNKGDNAYEGVVEKLVTITPDELKAEKINANVQVTEKNGVTVYTADTTSTASYYKFDFDLSHLSEKEIRALNEYVGIMGYSTTSRSEEQIVNEKRKYLSDLSFAVTYDMARQGKPVLVVSFYAFKENLDKALDLVFDMLYNTDLKTNSDYLRNRIATRVEALKNPTTAASYLQYSTLGNGREAFAIIWNLKGAPSFEYRKGLINSEKKFNTLIKTITSARKKMIKRNACTVIAIENGDKTKSVKKMLARLPKKNKVYRQGSYEALLKTPKSVAIVSNTGTAYVDYATAETVKLSRSNVAKTLAYYVASDELYLTKYRFEMGAYDAFCFSKIFGDFRASITRSPSFTEVLDDIDGMPKKIKKALSNLTDEELNGYKLSCLSSLLDKGGDIDRSYNEILNYAVGGVLESRYKTVNLVKKITLKDVQKEAKKIAKEYRNCAVAVLGTEAEIDANKDRFEEIYYLR